MGRSAGGWTFALITAGLCLLLPALYTSGISGATEEDWDVASTPVVRVPLDSLQDGRSMSLVFSVPATDQWARIRKAWGDPGYVVFCRTDDYRQAVLSWASLGLEVTGSTGLGPLELTAAGPVANSDGAADTGVVFRPRPGERVRLDVTAKSPRVLPSGELVVQANWDSNAKARMVGMVFSLNWRPYLRWGLVGGIVLLLAAATVGHWRTA